MIDYKKNDLIDECLVRFYETFEHTLDTADYVPEKYNDKILAYIFRCMKKQFKQIDRACRQIQKEQKARELMKKRAVKKRREQPGSKTVINSAVNDLIQQAASTIGAKANSRQTSSNARAID